MSCGEPLTRVMSMEMGRDTRPLAFFVDVVPAPVQMGVLATLGDLIVLAGSEKCSKKDLHRFRQALAEARFVTISSAVNIAIKSNLGSKMPTLGASLGPRDQTEAKEKVRPKSNLVSRHKRVCSCRNYQAQGLFFHQTQSDQTLPSISEGDSLRRPVSATGARQFLADEGYDFDLLELSDLSSDYKIVSAPVSPSSSSSEVPSSSALLSIHSTNRHFESVANDNALTPRLRERLLNETNNSKSRGQLASVANRADLNEAPTPQAVDVVGVGVAIGNGDDTIIVFLMKMRRPLCHVTWKMQFQERTMVTSTLPKSDDEHDDAASPPIARSIAFQSGRSSIDSMKLVIFGLEVVPLKGPIEQGRSPCDHRYRCVM